MHDVADPLAGLEAELLTLDLPQDQRGEIIEGVRDTLKGAHDRNATNDAHWVRIARRLQIFLARVNLLFDARIVRDPGGSILLELFIASHEGRSVSVAGVSNSFRLSPTTTLRHVERLEEAGMLARRDDPSDARRTLVEMTAKASAAMRRALVEVQAIR